MTGQRTGSKPVNLGQLEHEINVAGVPTPAGMGLGDELVYTYDATGVPTDFLSSQQPLVDQVIADHVAMRDKTDAEYATEFQDAATTPERQVEINHIMTGLMPREQVPM